jgi:hypothetical protein
MRKITIEENWHQQSEVAKNAKRLPHGKQREALLRKARQLDCLPNQPMAFISMA